MTDMVITRETFSHFRCHMEIAHQFLIDMQKIAQTLNTLRALFRGQMNNMQMTRKILSDFKIQFLKSRDLFKVDFHQRLPGWILAVLPRFRFSFILLLIESRRWAAMCVN